MSNFNFLQTEWPSIHREATEAEALTFISPKACTVICRSALEQTVRWMYDNDIDLEEPYDTRLSTLMHEQCFKNELRPSMFREINLIRKFGNNAAHGTPVRQSDALISIKNLFRFLSHVALVYTEDDDLEVPPFDESIIPTGKEKKEQAEELKLLQKQLDIRAEQIEAARKKQEEQAAENELLRQQVLQKEQLIKTRKETREQTIDFEQAIPQLVSESETRKRYINLSLMEAGWQNLRAGYELEYPVKGMPTSTNPSGNGFADYVLWGDNGKPLAVIEAKRTLVDARQGKHQAKLYADCLEQMHGQRPIIFYTNGFETFLWDDTFYPDRQVQGFYTKDELQLTIDRRTSRKDLRAFKVNEAIAGRYYQKEAIQRVSEAFVRQDKAGNLRAGLRKALLVMATGSGKTRTAVAIVDMLTKCDWAKRVLFLADRNALVTQAKKAFNEHLPHLSAIDLTKEKEDNGTRLVFSTYPTILNKIDSLKTDDNRFYGVGHFDLIIVDEAHRSVYQKYSAIFDYFDSLLIGLTATPKKDIHTNTYTLFEIDDDNPTHAYELNQAVNDEYLVPMKAKSVPIKFIREGIKYHELSEKDKAEYEEKFGDPSTEEAPDEISGSALNKWLFNDHTVDLVLDYLMTNGIHVEGGDKLGKTIIFAKNQKHADFIEERFNKNYPEYAGHFLQVIYSKKPKAQDLIDKFTDPFKDSNPQIAVSVDMMDTGIDAPRVVNLVFFKLIRSYTKFWQMIGRGTRLCPNLFGPNMNKDHFIIFDYCQNFEFFNENPDGASTGMVKPLTQRIFELKLDIIVTTREKLNATEEEKELEAKYLEELIKQVNALEKEQFQVRMNLRYVEFFRARSNWANLTPVAVLELKTHVSKLIKSEKGDHELARRLDIILLNLTLARLVGNEGGVFIKRVAKIAGDLSRINVPEVNHQKGLLRKLQTEEFWKTVHVKGLEEVRLVVRELMKYMEENKTEIVYTSIEDDIDLSQVRDMPVLELLTQLQSYKDRVESYIRKNKHHVTIQKLRSNTQITMDELAALETLLFDGTERGTKEEFVKEYGEQPLGVFIRSIVGLDIQAANEAFSEFLQHGNLRADQMTFIKNIITFLERNGTIDKSLLYESPFTDINDQGLSGVFDDADAHKVIHILDQINGNAKAG